MAQKWCYFPGPKTGPDLELQRSTFSGGVGWEIEHDREPKKGFYRGVGGEAWCALWDIFGIALA